MSRYIDADAYAAELWKLRENYQMLDDTHTADKIMHGIFRAEQVLKEQPSVDAVPVVHGEWIVDKNGYPQIICSICDVHIPMVAGWCMDAHIKYCPNCGAKMKGEQE